MFNTNNVSDIISLVIKFLNVFKYMLNVINYCVKEKVKIILHLKSKIILLIHFLNTIKEFMKSCNKDTYFIKVQSAEFKNLISKIISLIIKKYLLNIFLQI